MGGLDAILRFRRISAPNHPQVAAHGVSARPPPGLFYRWHHEFYVLITLIPRLGDDIRYAFELIFSLQAIGSEKSRLRRPWRIGDGVAKYAHGSQALSNTAAALGRGTLLLLAMIAVPVAAALPVESAPTGVPVMAAPIASATATAAAATATAATATAPAAAATAQAAPAPAAPAFPGHEGAASAAMASQSSDSGFEVAAVPDKSASAGAATAGRGGWGPGRMRFRDAVAAALVDPISLQIIFSGLGLMIAVAYLRRRRRRRLGWGVMPDRHSPGRDREHLES